MSKLRNKILGFAYNSGSYVGIVSILMFVFMFEIYDNPPIYKWAFFLFMSYISVLSIFTHYIVSQAESWRFDKYKESVSELSPEDRQKLMYETINLYWYRKIYDDVTEIGLDRDSVAIEYLNRLGIMMHYLYDVKINPISLFNVLFTIVSIIIIFMR